MISVTPWSSAPSLGLHLVTPATSFKVKLRANSIIISASTRQVHEVTLSLINVTSAELAETAASPMPLTASKKLSSKFQTKFLSPPFSRIACRTRSLVFTSSSSLT